jgi:hypothetical protein
MPGTIVLGLKAACSISGEVVLQLLVEDDLADKVGWGEGVRPDFRYVEDVDGEGGGGRGRGGDVGGVGGVVASGDGLEKVEGQGVRVRAGEGVWRRLR